MRQPLTAKQVLGFWMDCVDGASLRAIMNYERETDGNWEFDAKATRAICSLRVQSELPKSLIQANAIENAIRKAYSGTHDHNDVDLCNDFEDQLAESLIKAPLEPAYKFVADYGVTPPADHTLTELSELLGYATRSGAKQFMDDHGQFVPGVGKEFGRWWLQPGSLDSLREKKKSIDKAEKACKIECTTEGVIASAS